MNKLVKRICSKGKRSQSLVSVCTTAMGSKGRKWQQTGAPDSAFSSPKSLQTRGLGKASSVVQFCIFSASCFMTLVDPEILGFYVQNPPAAHGLKLSSIPTYPSVAHGGETYSVTLITDVIHCSSYRG